MPNTVIILNGHFYEIFQDLKVTQKASLTVIVRHGGDNNWKASHVDVKFDDGEKLVCFGGPGGGSISMGSLTNRYLELTCAVEK